MDNLSAIFYPKIDFNKLYIPHILKTIYMDGLYNEALADRKDLTIIDLGANCGLVTNYLRGFAKQVYSVEPANEHFEALKKNMEYNGWDNVKIFHAGMMDKDGTATLHLNDDNRTGHSFTAPYNREREEVKIYAMDTFFAENGIDHVDFVKMDVEGAEEAIIFSEGFLKIAPQIDAIMMEFHTGGWERLRDHMVSLGYQAIKPITDENLLLFKR